jgi:glycosyltransferase involved in cell wall biosynthesis
MRIPEVVLVRTPGEGSMDHCSQRLAEHVRGPVLDPDGFHRSGETFELRSWTPAALRAWRRDRRLAKRLRSDGRPVHFVNHHFARYGLALDRPYLVTVHDAMRWRDIHAEPGQVLIRAPSPRDRRLLEADRLAIRRAAGVITVSEHSADQIADVFGVPRERIAVVHNGIDHGRLVPDGPRAGGRPYLLYVGSEHPRKNLAGILQVLAALKREDLIPGLRLVKVGAPGRPARLYRRHTLELVRRLGLERDVCFTDRVLDAEVGAWYRGAACLLLPSRGEGFGLPAIEAMACGCPVIAGDAGALPEIAGPAALLVGPDDVAGLVEATRSVITRPGLRARLRAAGLPHAARFSWDRAARETETAYARFLDPPRYEPSRSSIRRRQLSVRSTSLNV